jgi:hypothetical protein
MNGRERLASIYIEVKPLTEFLLHRAFLRTDYLSIRLKFEN